jgi:uncharacterized protein (DUF58 family)
MARVAALLGEGVAPDGQGDPGALAAALWRVRKTARHHGLVVVVSDFRDTDNWERALRNVAFRHAVIAVEVVDPRESELPDSGTVVLSDPETGDIVEVDTSSPALRERFAAAERDRRARIATELRRSGARHVALSTEGDWLRSLAKAIT